MTGNEKELIELKRREVRALEIIAGYLDHIGKESTALREWCYKSRF